MKLCSDPALDEALQSMYVSVLARSFAQRDASIEAGELRTVLASADTLEEVERQVLTISRRRPAPEHPLGGNADVERRGVAPESGADRSLLAHGSQGLTAPPAKAAVVPTTVTLPPSDVQMPAKAGLSPANRSVTARVMRDDKVEEARTSAAHPKPEPPRATGVRERLLRALVNTKPLRPIKHVLLKEISLWPFRLR